MTKIKRVQAKATIKRVLTLEEIQAFMRQFSYRDALIVRMALVLGLRPAELFGLKWEDCDFRKKQLRIDETYALGEWKPTKTESSNGWVTLPDELIADLEQWRQQAEGSPYIFPAARGGNPVHSKKLLHQIIRPAAIKAGIMQPRPKHLPKGAFWNNKPTAVNFQVFRRTCATLLNANSKDIKATQSHLRHTDPNTTLKFYTAEVQEATRAAVANLDAILRAATAADNPRCFPFSNVAAQLGLLLQDSSRAAVSYRMQPPILMDGTRGACGWCDRRAS